MIRIMKYTILINSGPTGSMEGYSAYQFILAALAMGHDITRVFFYQDGIFHAFKHNTIPEDELNLTKKWSHLANEKGIDLVVCISAAQRRGLLSNDEAIRQGKQDKDLAEGFRISGLGQLMESILLTDRYIEFG